LPAAGATQANASDWGTKSPKTVRQTIRAARRQNCAVVTGYISANLRPFRKQKKKEHKTRNFKRI
jgi:hypothetical protein